MIRNIRGQISNYELERSVHWDDAWPLIWRKLRLENNMYLVSLAAG